jgi:hypothetical protein
MIKVIRAYDMIDNAHAFSVVANDKGFKYIFLNDKEALFDSGKRVQLILDAVKKDKKTLTVDDYLDLARYNLSNYHFSTPFEEPSEKIAIKSEKLKMEKNQEIEKLDEESKKSVGVALNAIDIEQVLVDFPELHEQLMLDDPDTDVTESGMLELVMAALGSVDPDGPNAWILDYLDGQEAKGFVGDLVFDPQKTDAVTAAAPVEAPDACPTATQDILLNLANRQKAIDGAGYGPLNPAEPNEEFWQAKADRWSLPMAEAKKSLCGNCAAFIVTSKMKQCIADGLQVGDENKDNSWDVVDAGDLGYCEAFDFKCAASRTCDAWIAGGPVTDETGKE